MLVEGLNRAECEAIHAAVVPAAPPAWPALAVLAKRSMDVVIAIAALVLLAPLLLLVALLVKVSSPGPVLFRQDRVGRGGGTFRMIKFRSMVNDAEARLVTEGLLDEYLRNECKLPVDTDPRVTRVGRMLRKTSVDELPQLWNVIRGEMSLVGPRPVVALEVPRYGRHFAAYAHVRPGLTGMWQVSGRNDVEFPARAQMDADYVERWSVWLDARILLRTVPAVLRQRGAA